jgi:hypothetical protein
MNTESGSFGIAHLSDLPITLSFGLVLLGVLVVLVLLRFLFADVRLSAGAGVK